MENSISVSKDEKFHFQHVMIFPFKTKKMFHIFPIISAVTILVQPNLRNGPSPFKPLLF